eukprot:601654_1
MFTRFEFHAVKGIYQTRAPTMKPTPLPTEAVYDPKKVILLSIALHDIASVDLFWDKAVTLQRILKDNCLNQINAEIISMQQDQIHPNTLHFVIQIELENEIQVVNVLRSITASLSLMNTNNLELNGTIPIYLPLKLKKESVNKWVTLSTTNQTNYYGLRNQDSELAHLDGLNLYSGDTDFVQCHLDLQIPDLSPLTMTTSQFGIVSFAKTPRPFSEYFDVKLFDNCTRSVVLNDPIQIEEMASQVPQYRASTIYDTLSIQEKCTTIGCMETFWNKYPSFWKWDRKVKITSLDGKGTVTNIIHKRHKIEQCYFELQSKMYATSLIPSGLFRGYEMTDTKHYKHVYIHSTGNADEDALVQVYACTTENDYKCDELNFVRFMKHNAETKQILFDRFHIDFDEATEPTFNEEGVLINGSLLGHLFPSNIKLFACDLQNEGHNTQHIKESTVDSYAWSTFEDSPKWKCFENQTNELVPLIDAQNAQFYLNKAWAIPYPLYRSNLEAVIPAPTQAVPDFRVNKCYWQCVSSNGYKPSAQQIQDIVVGCNEYGERVVSVVHTKQWTDPTVFFFEWFMKFDEYLQVQHMFEMNHNQLSIQQNKYYKCFVETAHSMNIQMSSALQKSECQMVPNMPQTGAPSQSPTVDPTTAEPTLKPTARPTLDPIDVVTTISPTAPNRTALVITTVPKGQHQRFDMTMSRPGLRMDTIELHRNMIAKAIALALVDEEGFMGYALETQILSQDEVLFRKPCDTAEDCNSFCSVFGYYRYNKHSKNCRCSHWLNTTNLMDKLQNSDEWDAVYLTKPSLEHWKFVNFASLQNDPLIPSIITFRNAKLYDPKLFKNPRNNLRCHMTMGTEPETADVVCVVDMCFATSVIHKDRVETPFILKVLEQKTLEWHTRKATDGEVNDRFQDDLYNGGALIENLDGTYDKECSTIQDIEDSAAVWDNYSEQRGAFVVTVVDFGANDGTQGSGSGSGSAAFTGNSPMGKTKKDKRKGKDELILTVDVVTDRAIGSGLCQLESLLSNFELMRKIQIKMQEFDALRFIEIDPVFSNFESNVPAPTAPLEAKNLSRSYTPTLVGSTPSPISITRIVFDLIHYGHDAYDIALTVFDDQTGMALQDLFDFGVFSCVEYVTPSRIVLPLNELKLISFTKSVLKYSIDVTDCKTAIEIATVLNNPLNYHVVNKFVQYALQRQWLNQEVCSYAVNPLTYEIVCCAWIHGYWNTNTRTRVLLWQDWKTCSFTVTEMKAAGTIQEDVILMGTQTATYVAHNKTIQWSDGTEWTADLSIYPHFKSAGSLEDKPLTNALKLGAVFANTTLRCKGNCTSDIDLNTIKLIEDSKLVDGDIISADCNNASIEYEVVGQDPVTMNAQSDKIVAYNIGSALAAYSETSNDNMMNIFVGGIQNQIDSGFDMESLFKPSTFIAKLVFDASTNVLTVHPHIAQDIDRRYPRFGRNSREGEDERAWGDVRDIQVGDECLYVIGYSPSLRAAYIHKMNVDTLHTIPPVLSLPDSWDSKHGESLLGVLSNHDLVVITRFSVEKYGSVAEFGSIGVIPKRFFLQLNPPTVELTPLPGIKPHFHALHAHYNEEDDTHYFYVSGHKINQEHEQNEAFITRYVEDNLSGERIMWSFGKRSIVNATYSVEVTETFPLSLSFDHIGNLFLLVGGTEFNKTNEALKWRNQYLDEEDRVFVMDKAIQVLIKFDKDLNVIFEHGYWPKDGDNKKIANIDCNLRSALSTDKYDSIYLSQTFCDDNETAISVNKFNWKCPFGTSMDWDDLQCHPHRIFCRCGFEVQHAIGIGVECFRYVRHQMDKQKLEMEEMLTMDYPRLNYWAAVCVRSMNYKIGESSESEWHELLDKIEQKSDGLRHPSDAYSVVDERYKARTRGSPPTFTHIAEDLHSFGDDLQPINGSIWFGDGDLVLSFSWVFLSHDIAFDLLSCLHDFGRNGLMLEECFETSSWDVRYGETWCDYVHNGLIHPDCILQAIDPLLKSQLIQLFDAFYCDTIDWNTINELNDTVRDIQALIFAQTMDFEEIVRFLGCWYCSYAQYYLLDALNTSVCIPFQHIGGINIPQKTEKIIQFIEWLVPAVDAIKDAFGMKLTRTLLMDITHIMEESWVTPNEIEFELKPKDLILLYSLQNIKLVEVFFEFLNEDGEALNDLDYNISLNEPFWIYKNNKSYALKMNTYSMRAYHHKFDVFEFHEEARFNDWFAAHVANNTDVGSEEVHVSPQHLLLLSHNVAIFNRFKFNHDLHFPSPFCQYKIHFNHSIQEQLHAIKIGFVIVADQTPNEFKPNMTELYPNVQWKHDSQWKTINVSNGGTRQFRNVWCQNTMSGVTVTVQDMFCAHLPFKPISVKGVNYA